MSGRRMKSATTSMVDRLRAGGNATSMTNTNRCVVMLDAADVLEEVLEALKAMLVTAEDEWGVDTHAFDACHKANQAIAKAEGGDS